MHRPGDADDGLVSVDGVLVRHGLELGQWGDSPEQPQLGVADEAVHLNIPYATVLKPNAFLEWDYSTKVPVTEYNIYFTGSAEASYQPTEVKRVLGDRVADTGGGESDLGHFSWPPFQRDQHESSTLIYVSARTATMEFNLRRRRSKSAQT